MMKKKSNYLSDRFFETSSVSEEFFSALKIYNFKFMKYKLFPLTILIAQEYKKCF